MTKADESASPQRSVAAAAQRGLSGFETQPWFQTLGVGAWLVLGIAGVLALVLLLIALVAEVAIPLAIAAVLDVPESESLGFKNLDDYRILASGRDIGGRSVLSCEAACYAGGAYNTTWQKALGTIGSIMAGGVSQNVLHGFPYRDVPGVQWPGFAAFSPYVNRTM